MDDVEIELQALITQREAMLQIMNRVTSEEVFKRYSEELIEVAKSIRALKSRRRPLQNTGSPKLPTLVEVETEFANQDSVASPTADEYNAIEFAYDYICRQLRAGA